MSELEIVDLDVLVKPVGRVLVFRKRYDVLPINGHAADLLQQIADRKGQGLNFVDVGRQIVADCIPTLSKEERTKLNVAQITSIIGVATQHVTKVRNMIAAYEGNEGGKVTKRRRSPARRSISR